MPDQTSFIKNRNSLINLRELLNVIQHTNANETKGLIFSLDAVKAFVHIKWPYLVTIMERFGLGEGFINFIKLIYYLPKASVLVNGIKLPEFVLGTSYSSGRPYIPAYFGTGH